MKRTTRRGLLIGGGAAVVAAAGIGWEQRRPLHTWYLDETGACGPSAPTPPDSHSKIVTGSLHSKTVPEPVEYAVSFPPGKHDRSTLPVVICMPGRGAGGPQGMSDLHLADWAAQAPSPIALAALDGGESYWHPRQTGEDRMTMLVREFLPMLQSTYGLGDGGHATFGWSMGGYGALLAAELYPRTFTAVAALSAAIWPTWEDVSSAVPDAFDSRLDYQLYDPYTHANRLAHTPVFIAVGSGDPFHPYDVAFATQLKPAPHTLFTAGCHDNNFWGNAAGPALNFLSRALARQAY